MHGFGERLVSARKKKNLSQKKLAELLGITPTRLNYWEKDKREPDFYMFTKILILLEADANDLLGLERQNKTFDGYSQLNSDGQKKVDDYIKDLSENPKYTSSVKSSDVSNFDNAVDITSLYKTNQTHKD